MPNCRNLVQCESIRLRATPAPFLSCPEALSGERHASLRAQTQRTCAQGQRNNPFKDSFELWWFSYLKYIYRSIFPFAYERKKLLPLNILAEYKFVMLF